MSRPKTAAARLDAGEPPAVVNADLGYPTVDHMLDAVRKWRYAQPGYRPKKRGRKAVAERKVPAGFSLPPSLKARARATAKEAGMRPGEWFIRAVEEKLARNR